MYLRERERQREGERGREGEGRRERGSERERASERQTEREREGCEGAEIELPFSFSSFLPSIARLSMLAVLSTCCFPTGSLYLLAWHLRTFLWQNHSVLRGPFQLLEGT
jgi:hypothetical protein